jgi:hypothetical protein
MSKLRLLTYVSNRYVANTICYLLTRSHPVWSTLGSPSDDKITRTLDGILNTRLAPIGCLGQGELIDVIVATDAGGDSLLYLSSFHTLVVCLFTTCSAEMEVTAI